MDERHTILKGFGFDSPETTLYFVKKNDSIIFPKYFPYKSDCEPGKDVDKDRCFRSNGDFYVFNYDLIDDSYSIERNIEKIRDKITILLNEMDTFDLKRLLKDIETLKKFPVLKAKRQENPSHIFSFGDYVIIVTKEKATLQLCKILFSKKKPKINKEQLELIKECVGHVVEEKFNEFSAPLDSFIESLKSKALVKPTHAPAKIQRRVKEPGDMLTKRQSEVLSLLRQGKSKAEIAKLLSCSAPNITQISNKLKNRGLI